MPPTTDATTSIRDSYLITRHIPAIATPDIASHALYGELRPAKVNLVSRPSTCAAVGISPGTYTLTSSTLKSRMEVSMSLVEVVMGQAGCLSADL